MHLSTQQNQQFLPRNTLVIQQSFPVVAENRKVMIEPQIINDK